MQRTIKQQFKLDLRRQVRHLKRANDLVCLVKGFFDRGIQFDAGCNPFNEHLGNIVRAMEDTIKMMEKES